MKANVQIGTVAVVAAVIFAGCVANGFKEFYQTVNIGPYAKLQPYSGSTQVYSSTNLAADGDHLGQKGYVPLGQASFQTGQRVTLRQIQEQGQAVGADIVLWASSDLGTEQATVPVFHYNPGTTSTTNTYGTATANAYGSGGYATANGSYSGISTTTTPGTLSTQMVPITIHRMAFGATFWRKRIPGPLGISTVDLPPDMRQTLQRNTGVLVRWLVDDSPAFKANILVGDVITQMNGVDVGSTVSFIQMVYAAAGQEVTLTVLRGGSTREIKVKLNP
ncbi:MAG: PDZ domain-containing protein [Opitutaceae bacterium]|jgi:membrane-associated protease RseP (regulator of RpoE activity)